MSEETREYEQVSAETIKEELALERSKFAMLEAKVKRLESLMAMYIK